MRDLRDLQLEKRVDTGSREFESAGEKAQDAERRRSYGRHDFRGCYECSFDDRFSSCTSLERGFDWKFDGLQRYSCQSAAGCSMLKFFFAYFLLRNPAASSIVDAPLRKGNCILTGPIVSIDGDVCTCDRCQCVVNFLIKMYAHLLLA